MNYWYSARSNEMFLDLDSNRAIARALSVLRLGLRDGRLPVKRVWLFGTVTRGHAHLILQLKQPWSVPHKIAWSLWLGNDRLRAAYVLRRETLGLVNPDLLVTPTIYHRTPDAFCNCTEKHKEPSVTNACEGMKHLLGAERSADYFSRTGYPPPKRKIRVPWGRVTLAQIRDWRPVYGKQKGLCESNGSERGIQRVPHD